VLCFACGLQQFSFCIVSPEDFLTQSTDLSYNLIQLLVSEW
jgi:hypothetical protein